MLFVRGRWGGGGRGQGIKASNAIVYKPNITEYLQFGKLMIFISLPFFYLASKQPTSGHWQGKSLTNPMLIATFVQILI